MKEIRIILQKYKGSVNDSYQQRYANRLNNLEEMGKPLGTH